MLIIFIYRPCTPMVHPHRFVSLTCLIRLFSANKMCFIDISLSTFTLSFLLANSWHSPTAVSQVNLKHPCGCAEPLKELKIIMNIVTAHLLLFLIKKGFTVQNEGMLWTRRMFALFIITPDYFYMTMLLLLLNQKTCHVSQKPWVLTSATEN